MQGEQSRRGIDDVAARFSALVGSLAEAVVIVDSEGLIEAWNPAATRLFGYSAEEASGRPLTILFPAGTEAEEMKLLERVAAGERFELYSCARKRKDGSLVDVGIAMSALRDSEGRVDGSLHIARDFTELKRIDAVLLESEERFRGAFDFAATGMALVGADGHWLRVNQALAAIVGRSEDELLATTYQAIAHPEDVMADEAIFSNMIEGTLGPSQAERRYIHKDGRVVWVLRSVALVRDSVDDPHYFIVQVQDVSARKEAEDQLRQSHKMQAIGQLAAGVAHDFNNLLTVIAGYADCLGEEIAPSDPKQELVTGIGDAVARAAMLTQQLLLFSRKAVVKPEVVAPNALVESTLKMLDRLIGEDIILTPILGEDVPSIRADPRQVEQTILNLAINARDAMPSGGRLTIETSRAFVGDEECRDHPERAPGQFLKLSVRDTGVGMSEHVRAHLFEPFFTTKDPGKGTGLGLAVVYGIVAGGSGFVAVDSRLGAGTTFDLFFPAILEGGERSSDRAEVRASPVPLGREVVLVVEDEDAVRRVACTALRRYGFVVLEAANGPDAVQVFERHPGRIDVLLTDVVMPGMNGRELAEILHSRDGGLKVLFMSGYNDDAVIRHGIHQSTAELIQKPFTPRLLVDKLRDVLGTRS
jgi:two-component system, cell cycle sensor histidine kinase and response regulator CckA